MVLLSLLLPTGTFWLVLAPIIRDRLMCGGLAVALGLGSASAILVATMAMRGRLDSTLVIIDLILWSGLAAVIWWFAAPPLRPSVAHPLRARVWTTALLLLAATLSLIAVVRSYAAAPHGAWDAWAIWNLRARFFATGADWTRAFSPALAWSHPDYPLMLPATVARLWASHGSQPTWIPAMVSVSCAGATLSVVAGSFKRHHRAAAGLALLTAPWAVQAAWQLADVPLSLFIASATTLLVIGTETGDSRLLALAGFASSLAAWTKQEGLVFVAAAAIALVAWDARGLPRWRALAVWMLGALPLLTLVAWFALVMAPQSSLAQPVTVAVGKLVDPTRHSAVVGALGGAAGPEWVVVYASAAILFAWNAGCAPVASLRAALMAALMFAGFYLVYLITPHPQRWHVETSLSRLLAQTWPLVVLAVGYSWGSTVAVPAPDEHNSTRS